MITNTGQSIIIKYLLGQAPAYASYIAAGCGAKPVERINFTVTEKALVSGEGRITIGSHDFVPGDYITVSNVDTTFDGVHVITAVSSDKVTYALPGFSNVGSFASPISVSPTGTASRNYSNKKNLDFEMFRVPITSRGYVQEDGVSKVVLTGSIPSSDRYEITELGVFSAASNPAAQLSDSRNIYLFVNSEGWQYHTPSSSISIPTVSNKLDLDPQNAGKIYLGSGFNSEIVSTNAECFVADSSNTTFESEIRISRQERSRNLGPSIFLRGDSSNIQTSAPITAVVPTATTATYTTSTINGILPGDSVVVSGLSPSGYNGTFTVISSDNDAKTFTVANTTNATVTDATGSVQMPRFVAISGSHIHNANNVNLTLNNNSSIDELRCAFSIVSTEPTSDGESDNPIGSVRVLLSFEHAHQTPGSSAAFAQMEIELPGSTDFTKNRYFSISKKLEELKTYGNFSWASANIVSAYACVLDSSGVPTNKYFVALDGLRLENISANNPLYGLVGYSVVQNQVQGASGTYAKPIIKLPNTSNFIEFRYSVDVV